MIGSLVKKRRTKKLERANRHLRLFSSGNSTRGLHNHRIMHIREIIQNMDDENINSFREKMELKTFNALFGRDLLDSNVEKLKLHVDDLQSKYLRGFEKIA